MLLNVCVTNINGYILFVVITIRSFPHLLRITGIGIKITRRLPHVEQELPTLPEHLSLPPVFSGVRLARSLAFCVVFCRSLFVLSSCPLYCLSVFDVQLLITSLVSSNCSIAYTLMSVLFNCQRQNILHTGKVSIICYL